MIGRWTKAGEAKSVGLLENAGDIFPESRSQRIRPGIVTDKTGAYDPVNGYLPQGWTMAQWREIDPKAVEVASRASLKTHVSAMVDFWNDSIPVLNYGNNIRQMALEKGLEFAYAFPGFVPAYIRPLFCRRIGPAPGGALYREIWKTSTKRIKP